MRYEIKIPKPCHENWNEMTPTEKGAFCSNCKKEVFDYTSTSNYQLAKLLDSEKKLCGKFRPEQLNRTISSVENSKYSSIGMILSLSTFLSVITPVFSQTKSTKLLQTKEYALVTPTRVVNKKENDSLQLKGIVKDGTSGLPYAVVILKDREVKTDKNGKFSINISKKESKRHLSLDVFYTGYLKQEVKVTKNTLFITVRLFEDNTLGEIVITKKPSLFGRIGNLFRKKNCHE